jgi:hypothetical protein
MVQTSSYKRKKNGKKKLYYLIGGSVLILALVMIAVAQFQQYPMFFENCDDLSEWLIEGINPWISVAGQCINTALVGITTSNMTSQEIDLSNYSRANLSFESSPIPTPQLFRVTVNTSSSDFVTVYSDPTTIQNVTLQLENFISLPNKISIRGNCRVSSRGGLGSSCIWDNINVTGFDDRCVFDNTANPLRINCTSECAIRSTNWLTTSPKNISFFGNGSVTIYTNISNFDWMRVENACMIDVRSGNSLG